MAKFSNLRNKALELNAQGGVPFMEGRTKDELPEGELVTVVDYGFIKDPKGDYVVLALKEYPQFFYFGGSVVTEKFKALDVDLTEDDREELHTEGLPVAFAKKISKRGKREYTTCVFFPDGE